MVRRGVVHQDEEALAGLHGGGDECGGGDFCAARRDGDLRIGRNAETFRIAGVDFDVDFRRVKFAEHVGFPGAGVCVPLRGGATPREEDKGISGIDRLGRFPRLLEKKFRAAIGVEKFPILKKQPLLRRCAGVFARPRPLHAAAFVDHAVVLDAGDVARLAMRKLLHDLENHFRRRPAGEHIAAAPILGDQLEDIEVGKRLAGRA